MNNEDEETPSTYDKINPFSIDDGDEDAMEVDDFEEEHEMNGMLHKHKLRTIQKKKFLVVFLSTILICGGVSGIITRRGQVIDSEEGGREGLDDAKTITDHQKNIQSFGNEKYQQWAEKNPSAEKNTAKKNSSIEFQKNKYSLPEIPTHSNENRDNESNVNDEGYTMSTMAASGGFTLVGSFDHDTTSFTQGLTYGNGKLYESTGLYGHSKVRELDPNNGAVLQSLNMDADYFGEGMTLYDSNTKLIQITYKKKTAFIYTTQPRLQQQSSFTYQTTNGEGWGITHDAQHSRFFVSDGTSYLHIWNQSFQQTSKIQVKHNGSPLKNLNELEYINGRVFANIWLNNNIAIINPATGIVEQMIDFSSLVAEAKKHYGADVLNGISTYKNGEVLITGKKWPKIYRVMLLNFNVRY